MFKCIQSLKYFALNKMQYLKIYAFSSFNFSFLQQISVTKFVNVE